MAQRALPAGAYRRRALFGLVDADGWGWAFVKALFWFFLIIFLLGYLPDRAYYFTVFPTLDVGANVISPVNFCDASNKNLPCPAPAGAVVPWETSPNELKLPQPRTASAAFQSGTTMYLVGGNAAGNATDSVLTTQVTTTGNFGQWSEGPKLPAPRAQSAVVAFTGVPYVIGGLDASDNPTDTVFVGQVEEGELQGWEASDDLKLPQPLTGAAVVAGANGLWVFGGSTTDEQLSAKVYRSRLGDQNPPALGKWEEVAELPLPEARANALGVLVGSYIYLLGGDSPNGISNTILRLQLGATGDPETAGGRGWATSQGSQSMPEPRTQASGFSTNGAIYVIGGRDARGAVTRTLFWATPSGSTGDIPEWQRLEQSNLPEPRAGAASAVVGSFAFLVGGENEQGAVDTSLRSNVAPKAPFFRLGLFGATIPALSIKGEIGQQLGYINAFGLGITNFVILVLLAYAFSHRPKARRFMERVTRGRYRAPREEDEYIR